MPEQDVDYLELTGDMIEAAKGDGDEDPIAKELLEGVSGSKEEAEAVAVYAAVEFSSYTEDEAWDMMDHDGSGLDLPFKQDLKRGGDDRVPPEPSDDPPTD